MQGRARFLLGLSAFSLLIGAGDAAPADGKKDVPRPASAGENGSDGHKAEGEKPADHSEEHAKDLKASKPAAKAVAAKKVDHDKTSDHAPTKKVAGGASKKDDTRHASAGADGDTHETADGTGHADVPADPGFEEASDLSAISFAARLAQSDDATYQLWDGDPAKTWKLVGRHSADRQQVRWDTARAWIGRGRGAEALGLLDLMVADEPRLDLVPQFRLARGVALTLLDRHEEALGALDQPELVNNSEACAWHMLAAERSGDPERAIGMWYCAETAMSTRPQGDAAKFNLALARAYMDTGKPVRAAEHLARIADRDAEANLMRGVMLAKAGKGQEAELRFERAAVAGGPLLQQRIRFERIVLSSARNAKEALKQLDEFLFKYRGGDTETEALDLGMKLAREEKEDDLFLQLAAAKLRYYPATENASELSADIVGIVAKGLSPDSKLPLTKAADRLWSYRDLVPSGTQGDALLYGLTRRLEEQGLYARAAELLSFHASRQPRDVTRGPLSVRIARDWILAREPKRAFQAASRDNDIEFGEDITAERDRLQAVALYHLGQKKKAAALLASLPGGEALLRDMAWQDQDWKGFAALASRGPADERSALRLAIAYALQGDDEAAAALGKARRASMRSSNSAALFEALTGDLSKLDSETVGAAMSVMDDIGVDPLIAAHPVADPSKKTAEKKTPVKKDAATDSSKTLASK